MSAGKKGKKKKGKTVALTEFLADGGNPGPTIKSTNWADEVENEHDSPFMTRSAKEPIVLPSAPRAARDPGVDEENIPTNPPYVAYISNLPYDVNEEDLYEFFGDAKIASMRLPKDSNKLRGYGYIEFEDRQSLIDSLSMPNTTMKTRRIRIEVSTNSNEDRRGGAGGRMNRDNRRDDYGDPERTAGDWRSGPRVESSGGSDDRYRSSRFENRERREDREPSENDNKPGGWREGGDKGFSAFKDRGGYRDDERDKERDSWTRRDRDSDRDRDRGGSSSFGPRKYGGDSERDSDRDWNRDRRPRNTFPEEGRDAAEPSSEGRTRPKLNLQKRTIPLENEEAAKPSEEASESTEEDAAAPAAAAAAAAAAPPPAPTGSSNANIFGAAKPVDTAAKEREIEERMAKIAETKKEEAEAEKRITRENAAAAGKRNGEEKSKPTWRSEEDRGKPSERSHRTNISIRTGGEQRGDSRSSNYNSRAGPPARGPKSDSRGPSERDRRDKEQERDQDRDSDEEIIRMPKAKEEHAPNFIASNKYSMLPDDVDPDNINN